MEEVGLEDIGVDFSLTRLDSVSCIPAFASSWDYKYWPSVQDIPQMGMNTYQAVEWLRRQAEQEHWVRRTWRVQRPVADRQKFTNQKPNVQSKTWGRAQAKGQKEICKPSQYLQQRSTRIPGIWDLREIYKLGGPCWILRKRKLRAPPCRRLSRMKMRCTRTRPYLGASDVTPPNGDSVGAPPYGRSYDTGFPHPSSVAQRGCTFTYCWNSRDQEPGHARCGKSPGRWGGRLGWSIAGPCWTWDEAFGEGRNGWRWYPKTPRITLKRIGIDNVQMSSDGGRHRKVMLLYALSPCLGQRQAE